MTLNPNKKFIDQAMERIAGLGYVLDVGGGARFSKWMSAYKHLFPGDNYHTFDFDSSTNADIVGDIHSIPLPDESVDGIICHSVLEHVRNPLQAMGEMTRILKKDGVLFCYVPSVYPYHAREGHYPDYWRFFEETIRELFSSYSHIEIQKYGGYFLMMSFFLPKQHKLRWLLNPPAIFLDKLFPSNAATAGYFVYAIK